MDRQKLVAALRDIVGEANVLTGDALVSRLTDVWNTDTTVAMAVVRPQSTAEVSAIMALCHAQGQTVVPEGGRTNLVRGTEASPADILLSLERMNRIGEIDRASRSVVVEAGAIVQRVQEAAAAAGLRFGLDFGARGSAQIGGALAMNAGGIQVLRYGAARAQVLGLEVVLADGTVLEHLTAYTKDNTGYDLKQLFIGSEGTLGIITRARLRLVPLPKTVETAILGFHSFSGVTHLLDRLSRDLAGTLSSFEVMWRAFYDMNTAEGYCRPPVRRGLPYYVLCEAEGFDEVRDRELFEGIIADALELPEELAAADVAVAQSGRERADFWRIREDFEAESKAFPAMAGFDISVAINQMEAFGEALGLVLPERLPDFLGWHIFGHVADGNLHVVVGLPDAALKPAANELVYELVKDMGGSISAEHGIGRSKRAWLSHSRSPQEIAAMRAVKAALDPKAILNPGKVL